MAFWSINLIRPLSSPGVGCLAGGLNLDLDLSLVRGPRTSSVVMDGLGPALCFLVGNRAGGVVRSSSCVQVRTRYSPT